MTVKELKYLIICLEEKAFEGSMLFYKPNSAGYTSKLEKAGWFTKDEADKINRMGRDIVLTESEIMKLKGFIKETLVYGDLSLLQTMKEKMKRIR